MMNSAQWQFLLLVQVTPLYIFRSPGIMAASICLEAATSINSLTTCLFSISLLEVGYCPRFLESILQLQGRDTAPQGSMNHIFASLEVEIRITSTMTSIYATLKGIVGSRFMLQAYSQSVVVVIQQHYMIQKFLSSVEEMLMDYSLEMFLV